MRKKDRPGQHVFVVQDRKQQKEIEDRLAEMQPEKASEGYCRYSFRFTSDTEKVSVKQYRSGKLLVQGKMGPLYSAILDAVCRTQARLTYSTPAPSSAASFAASNSSAASAPSASSASSVSPFISYPYAGIDEAGKGDYFGPLVIAAVWVDEKAEKSLLAAGVRDSKKVSDAKCHELAEAIMGMYPENYEIVEISPERYNSLYSEMKAEGKNLNTLLAWGHARALESLLARLPCQVAVSDKFGDERYIQSKLMDKGRTVKLVQETKAERYMAVAAASILARHRFLSRLKSLSESVGTDLPKGASNLVIEAARNLVDRDGPQVLQRVAKVHFKTTQDALKHAPR